MSSVFDAWFAEMSGNTKKSTRKDDSDCEIEVDDDAEPNRNMVRKTNKGSKDMPYKRGRDEVLPEVKKKGRDADTLKALKKKHNRDTSERVVRHEKPDKAEMTRKVERKKKEATILDSDDEVTSSNTHKRRRLVQEKSDDEENSAEQKRKVPSPTHEDEKETEDELEETGKATEVEAEEPVPEKAATGTGNKAEEDKEDIVEGSGKNRFRIIKTIVEANLVTQQALILKAMDTPEHSAMMKEKLKKFCREPLDPNVHRLVEELKKDNGLSIARQYEIANGPKTGDETESEDEEEVSNPGPAKPAAKPVENPKPPPPPTLSALNVLRADDGSGITILEGGLSYMDLTKVKAKNGCEQQDVDTRINNFVLMRMLDNTEAVIKSNPELVQHLQVNIKDLLQAEKDSTRQGPCFKVVKGVIHMGKNLVKNVMANHKQAWGSPIVIQTPEARVQNACDVADYTKWFQDNYGFLPVYAKNYMVGAGPYKP
jgi:hypothetical protein